MRVSVVDFIWAQLFRLVYNTHGRITWIQAMFKRVDIEKVVTLILVIVHSKMGENIEKMRTEIEKVYIIWMKPACQHQTTILRSSGIHTEKTHCVSLFFYFQQFAIGQKVLFSIFRFVTFSNTQSKRKVYRFWLQLGKF